MLHAYSSAVLLITAACVAVIIAIGVSRRYSAACFGREASFVTIAVPSKVDPAGSTALWMNLHDTLRPRWRRFLCGQPHVSFEFKWSINGMQIGLWVPKALSIALVERAVESAWPGVKVESCVQVPALFEPTSRVRGGELRFHEAEWFPIKTDHDVDPLRSVFGAIGSLRDGEQAIVQVLARPTTGKKRARAFRAARLIRSAKNPSLVERAVDPVNFNAQFVVVPDDPSRSTDTRLILNKVATPSWEASIRYGVSTNQPGRLADAKLRARAHSLASAFALYSGRNRFKRTRIGRSRSVLESRHLRSGNLYSVPELAAIAHLPLDETIPGIERAGSRCVAPTPRIPTTGKVIGDADMGARRPIAVAPADLPFHFHVLGATGVGKSTLLTNMVLGDVEAKRGAIVIDPKGDLVTDILSRLDSSMKNNLVLFDPANPQGTPSMNVLEGSNSDLVVDNLVGIFRRIFESYWGPRTDDVLRSACLTLLSGGKSTLDEVPRILTEPEFRRSYVRKLNKSSGLVGFWNWYDEMSEGQRAQVIGPVMNKLRAFLLRDFVRNIVGAGESDFNMNDILDGGLLLVRLPKGSLGTETTKLLGSLVVARVWQTALARIESDPSKRLSSTLYVDECHNFLNLPIGADEMLAEARGYGLSLVLAHQHLGQLGREMRDAISSNARNKVFFTMSPEDAWVLERHVKPELAAYDLANLGGYQVAARLIANGRPLPACTVQARPAIPAVDGRIQQMRAATAQRLKNKKRKNVSVAEEEMVPASAYGSAPASVPGLASGDHQKSEDAGSEEFVLPGSTPRLTEKNR